MRNVNDNAADNDFRKFQSYQRDLIQQEIFRLANISDRTADRRRNGPLNHGGLQMMNVEGGSDYATVGGTMGSTVVGS